MARSGSDKEGRACCPPSGIPGPCPSGTLAGLLQTHSGLGAPGSPFCKCKRVGWPGQDFQTAHKGLRCPWGSRLERSVAGPKQLLLAVCRGPHTVAQFCKMGPAAKE